MSRKQPQQASSLGRTVKKYLVSGFVVVTFVAYALHERTSNSNGLVSAVPPTQGSSQARQALSSPPLMSTPTPFVFVTPQQPTTGPTTESAAPAVPPAPNASPTDVPPTDVPPTEAPPTAIPNGQYKDGTYTGQTIDVVYGLLQVQAVVQDGKLASVQFLQYPNDRRTSVRINSVAIPYLQTEAIQAQSASVNIISGATLTSEGFAMSLQSALAGAKN
jgi:uncharacterized protein with FMN-binding domain